jgi:large subunit ribosomal protein L22
MKASLSNYRQSPRKTRLVTDLVKGKTVDEALTALKFLEKRAANPIAKLIASALANAEKQGENGKMLVVKSITVNKGLVRTKSMPRAFGRATPIRRRMSHVAVVLGKK